MRRNPYQLFAECVQVEVFKNDRFIAILKKLLFNIEAKVIFEYRLAKLLYDKKSKGYPIF